LFCAIASTGRTATSFLAECLNRIPGVAALHEGHLGNDDGPDILPLVNLENLQAFKSPDAAAQAVAKKRSPEILNKAISDLGVQVLFDVAYYNSVILDEILRRVPDSRGVCVIRDCESFVRSATWLQGEDPMPVGWPDPDKPLSTREKFIAMGRVRPVESDAAAEWAGWGATRRNIWLWKTTNHILIDVCLRWSDRVDVIDFQRLVRDPAEVITAILAGVGHRHDQFNPDVLNTAISAAFARQNERTGGYQLQESSTWSAQDRELLHEAQESIDERVRKLYV
jgi:hypothetical protein